MARLDGPSTVAGGVLKGDIGTALVAGDVAIGAGWGTTGTKAIATGSNAQRGKITVTASGASFAQATATIVITFPEPYTTAPFALVTTTNDNSIDTGHATWSTTTTALTITFSVLPVDTKIYVFTYALVM